MRIHNRAEMGYLELQTTYDHPVCICVYMYACTHACVHSVISNFLGTLGTVTHQASLSMGFSWPEY